MSRRLGLAAALCLTTVVAFAVVVLGREAGLFGGGPASRPAANAAPLTAGELEATPAAPTPVVVEQYVYVDRYYSTDSGSSNAPPGDGSTSPRDSNTTPGSSSTPAGSSSAHPTRTPTPRPSQPTAPPPAPRDDGAPPPTATAVPPQPVAPPPPAVIRTEFVGVITGLAGDRLTVSTGGSQTTVIVAPGTEVSGRLSVGAVVHVHAQPQTDGTLVATEIEVSGGDDGE